MSTGPLTLWIGTTPRTLANSREKAAQHRAEVVHHSLDVDGPFQELIRGFEDDPDPKTALDIAVFVAGTDSFMRGESRPSNRAMGWLMISGSMGREEANLIITIAHLLDLRDQMRRANADEGGSTLDPDALHALWSAYRCSWRLDDAPIVRRFCTGALQRCPSPKEVADVIAQIDTSELTPIFLPVETFRDNRGTGGRRHAPVEEAARVRVVSSIGDTQSSEGRKFQRTYGHLTEPMPLTSVPTSADTVCDVMMSWFPWMEKAVEAVSKDLRLAEVTGRPWLQLRPLLLEGPPGCGKSFFAEKLADLLGGRLARIDAGGSSDNRLLAGTARGWSGAQPAYPLLAIARTGVANPLIQLDEVDKARASHNGDLHATLLGMLDAKTARRWPDECLMGECDLSRVSWLLTANDASTLPEALLSRVRRVRLDVPGERHADAALASIAADVRQQLEWPSDAALPVPTEVWGELRDALAAGRDFRTVAGAIYTAIASGEKRPQTVH
jgi:hypothetical protein